MSSEWALLLACSAGREEVEELLRSSDLQISELNFDELIRLALWHGIAPLLALSLESYSDQIPRSAIDRLKQIHDQSLRRNLYLNLHLSRVLEKLKDHGVQAIPFKGPVLSERLYGSVALRQCSDLDIIVRPDDLPLCLTTLQELGFDPERPVSPERIALLVASDFEITLVHQDIPLDLHWGVMPLFCGIQFDLEKAFHRANDIRAEGTAMLEFTPEDLFLALALHSSKHFWSRLVWLSDLDRLLSSTPDFDWGILMERARIIRVERVVLIAVALLRDVLGTRSATLGDLHLISKQHGEWRSAYEMARTNLCSPNPEIEGLKTYYFFLKARDTGWDAARQLQRHIVRPTSSELFRRTTSLPAAFYFPMHIWRLTLRLLRFVWAAQSK